MILELNYRFSFCLVLSRLGEIAFAKSFFYAFFFFNSGVSSRESTFSSDTIFDFVPQRRMRAWRRLFTFLRCSCAYVRSNTNSKILSQEKVESRDETQEYKKKKRKKMFLQKLFPLAISGPEEKKNVNLTQES